MRTAHAEPGGRAGAEAEQSTSHHPAATELLETPGALLTRTHLRELGLERRAVDAVFRTLPVVALPGYSRPMIRAEQYLEARRAIDVSRRQGTFLPMPSVWITTRATARGGKRYRVMYRLGGRESMPRYGGTFSTRREALVRKTWVMGELAAMRVPDHRLVADHATPSSPRSRPAGRPPV